MLLFIKGCRQTKKINDFFDKNNEMKATCKDCRERNGASKRQKREQNAMENYCTVHLPKISSIKKNSREFFLILLIFKV